MDLLKRRREQEDDDMSALPITNVMDCICIDKDGSINVLKLIIYRRTKQLNQQKRDINETKINDVIEEGINAHMAELEATTLENNNDQPTTRAKRSVTVLLLIELETLMEKL